MDAMTVWVVTVPWDEEDMNDFYGVFSTEELAREYIASFPKDWWMRYEVNAIELDSPFVPHYKGERASNHVQTSSP